jgi:hypothetical protein
MELTFTTFRILSGNSMSGGKFLLLTVHSLVALFEGLFESAPQLVLQLVILLCGVHELDLKLLFAGEEQHMFSWPWFRGLFYLLGLAFSFVSLVVTVVYYNDERWTKARPQRFFSVLAFSISSVMYRVIVCAVLFSVAPFWSLFIMAVLYLANLVTFKAAGQSWECVLYSYVQLLAPSGFAKESGDGFHSQAYRQKSRYSYAGGDSLRRVPVTTAFSEVERAKITQEDLIKRVRVSHGLFSCTR